MPFTFLIVGTVLLIAGVRGTDGDLYELLKRDLTGKPNFLYWMAAILLIGSLGYVEKLRTVSRMFLVLVIIVLFLANKGFFDRFMQEFFSSGTGEQQQ